MVKLKFRDHIFFFLLCFALPLKSQIADFAFSNAKIFTANNAQPFAEAMAIQGKKIIYVGDNLGLSKYIDSNTKVENVDGRVMLPGIHDIHIHPLEASSPIGGPCILDSWEYDPEILGQALFDCALEPNSNGWITGWGHSIFTLFDANRPSKGILDDFFPDIPVCILEETSHSVWVNSKALEIMAITEDTPDPVGGHIYKFPFTGEIDGILMDNAGDAVLQLAFASNPEIDAQNYQGLIEYGLPLLAKNGITSISEGRTYWKRNYQKIWKKILDENKLTARVTLAPWIYPDENDNDLIDSLSQMYAGDNELLKVTQVKCYSDGIIHNATAAFHEPYDDNNELPFDNGLNYIDQDRLSYLVLELEKLGYDFHIHAIGDRAVTESLDAIEWAAEQNGDMDRRHRVTHLEIVDPNDYERFYELNVIADMQVAGEWTNPNAWQQNAAFIGSERSQNIIPLKSIYETGAHLTLSSDWDVSTLNPFSSISNALTRAPQNLPTVEAAIEAYTIEGAYAMRQENQTGSIEVGKWADFIQIDRDIFSIDFNDIAETKVLNTWMNGKEIYRASEISSVKTTIVAADQILKISPNPSGDYLFIDFLSEDLSSIEIYNSAGAFVKAINPLFKNAYHLNTFKMAAGNYSLHAYLKNGNLAIQKFNVSH